jgi:hypothetical protein
MGYCCWSPCYCWRSCRNHGVASISEVPFELAVAGSPVAIGFLAVDGVLAVASIPADPGVRRTFHLEEKDISKVEETPRKGKTLELKEKIYVLYIGPIKENDTFFPYYHQLGILYCKDKPLTRRQAREALAHALEIKPDDFHVQLTFLIAKPNTYLDYAWNSSNLTKSE